MVQLACVEAGRARHTGAGDGGHRLVFVPAARPRRDLAVQRHAVLNAGRGGRKARVDEQVWPLDGRAQRIPMVLVDGHQVDVVVRAEWLAAVDVHRRQTARVATARRRSSAPGGADEGAGAHIVGHRLLHGELDLLAFAGAQPLDVGGEDGHGGLHPGAGIAGGGARHHGRAIRFAGDGKGAGRGLRHHVHGTVAGVRAAQAEALDAGIDESRVHSAQGVVADVQPFDDAGAVVLHEDIELRRQAQQQFPPGLAAQIQGDAALVGVPSAKVRGIILVLGAAHATPRIAVLRRLHLHHVRAEPRERLRAGRAGLVLGHVQHPHAIQCGHRCSLRSTKGQVNGLRGRQSTAPAGWRDDAGAGGGRRFKGRRVSATAR